MTFRWKAALALALMTSAAPSQAAFFTYTFNIAGSGSRETLNFGTGQVTYDIRQAATIRIGLTSDSADGGAGSDWYSLFQVTQGPAGASFSFSPLPNQSTYYATGQGASCVGCGTSYEVRSRGGYAETFNGAVSSYGVTRSDLGTDFLEIISYVPEPSTWALMLAGFGMMAYALRRRPRLAYAA